MKFTTLALCAGIIFTAPHIHAMYNQDCTDLEEAYTKVRKNLLTTIANNDDQNKVNNYIAREKHLIAEINKCNIAKVEQNHCKGLMDIIKQRSHQVQILAISWGESTNRGDHSQDIRERKERLNAAKISLENFMSNNKDLLEKCTK